MKSNCPFALGDFVRFRPSDYDLAKLSVLELYGILPGDSGKVVRIDSGRYVWLAKSKMGLDWEMFTKAQK